MISKITKGTQPIGLFCGGSGVSGGTIAPIISQIFPTGPSTSEVNFSNGFPSIYSKTTSNGILSISVNADTLYSQGGGVGTYVFSYYNDQSSNKWKVSKDGGEPVLNISLSSWGIQGTGTPVVGEGFTVVLEMDGNNVKKATVTSIERVNTGKKFLIGDCNLIGYLGTLQQWRRQMGGIRTFNQEFSSLIGGYPKGIVLDALVLYDGVPKLRKALSLKDDNDTSFLLTSGEEVQKYNEVPLTDPALMDNINWAFCDEFNPNYAIGSSLPATVICSYYAYSNDFNITGKITRSRTVSSDSRLYLAENVVSFSSVYGGSGSVTVTVTRNGQTKNYFVPGSQYYNGMIVRAGSTITVTVTCYKCISAQVYIYAIPVHSSFKRI